MGLEYPLSIGFSVALFYVATGDAPRNPAPGADFFANGLITLFLAGAALLTGYMLLFFSG